jgi:HAD superfamily hydrolase (TIGR01509 family)
MTMTAVIFDLDGVLIDSEPVWERVRRAYVAEHGGQWLPDTQARLMGMSTTEWATYLSTELSVGLDAARIAEEVSNRMIAAFAAALPLLPGATGAVRRMAALGPVGLASSSPLPVIRQVLAAAGLAGDFAAVTSSDEVARGKPAPDVYLCASQRLGVDPSTAAAVEDSTNGLRAAAAAGLAVIALPRANFPPEPGALALARAVLDGPRALDRLTPALLAGLPGA